jgi:Branched-chain amino acid transport system / permease component
MNDYPPFIVAGLTTGSVYGLAGSGLVLTYKTSGIFNFGYGALATIAAYLFNVMRVEHHLNLVGCLLVCVVPLGVLAGEARPGADPEPGQRGAGRRADPAPGGVAPAGVLGPGRPAAGVTRR